MQYQCGVNYNQKGVKSQTFHLQIPQTMLKYMME